jgi:hypothetical protein
VIKVSPEGEVVWRYELTDPDAYHLAVDEKGFVYVPIQNMGGVVQKVHGGSFTDVYAHDGKRLNSMNFRYH